MYDFWGGGDGHVPCDPPLLGLRLVVLHQLAYFVPGSFDFPDVPFHILDFFSCRPQS